MHKARHTFTGVTNGLEWVYACVRHARGIVFVPPLIGGHAVQQVRMLRRLLHRRFNIFSFNYAGHGQSEGRFCLRNSLDNTLHMLDLSLGYGVSQQLPVFGVASCFAAMPLLNAVRLRGEPMHRIVLVNAVPDWRLARAIGHFLSFWRQSDQWRLTWDGLLQAVRAYRDDLLPGLTHRRQSFGVLPRDRVHWSRVIYELFSQGVLPFAAVLKTPVLCVYGQRDHLLRQIGFSSWTDYETRIQAICPRVQFKPFNSDYFLAKPTVRGKLIHEVGRFFCSRSNTG